MRKNALILVLLMITTTLAGCMGDGEEESVTIVGDWYAAEEKIYTFNSNGTTHATYYQPGEVRNWSVDGNIITVDSENPVFFHVSDGWLFLTEEEGGNCVAFSSEIIGNEEAFLSATENLTLPSICGSLGYEEE
jgi:hypothetical protein